MNELYSVKNIQEELYVFALQNKNLMTNLEISWLLEKVSHSDYYKDNSLWFTPGNYDSHQWK